MDLKVLFNTILIIWNRVSILKTTSSRQVILIIISLDFEVLKTDWGYPINILRVTSIFYGILLGGAPNEWQVAENVVRISVRKYSLWC